jgi:hypothetical protein
MQDYVDSKGIMFCGKHRREVCNICCVDHRFCNDIVRAGENADIDAIVERNDAIQNAEYMAMTQRAAQTGGGDIVLGSERAQRLYEEVASRPGQNSCATCGIKGDKLSMCGRCKAAL